MEPKVSIIIPVYDEEAILAETIHRLERELAGAALDYEIIIAENGSTDRTGEIGTVLSQANPRVKLLTCPVANYGFAMKEGFKVAAGEYLFNFDIDYTSVDFVQRSLEAFLDYDIIICSKRVLGTRDQRPLYRKLITGGFNYLLKLLFKLRVVDTHGIKGFKREVIEKILPLTVMEKDLFDTEIVIRAEKEGYRIKELPAEIQEIRKARSSILKRIPRTFMGLLKLRSKLRVNNQK